LTHAPPTKLLPLELDGVGFRNRGQTLLHPTDLHFDPDGKTLIMGPNGAGKSLLMRIAHGLIEPTYGRVRWRGGAATSPTVRRRQAMVFQRPVMLRRSAHANIRYALAVAGLSRRARRQRSDDAIDRFGLRAIAHRPARVLSAGEQQRLALARAWALRPEVLFLDEPTAALDPAAIKSVEEAVTAFHRAGTRIVMTTHDFAQARRLADEIVLLVSGRVVERTPASEFFDNPRSHEGTAFLVGELIW